MDGRPIRRPVQESNQGQYQIWSRQVGGWCGIDIKECKSQCMLREDSGFESRLYSCWMSHLVILCISFMSRIFFNVNLNSQVF